MATLIIKSNAGTVADVLIKDLGIYITQAGGQETLTQDDSLKEAQTSRDLRDYLTDDSFGAGSSTLILNDGVSDIDQTDALNFLDTVILPSGDFGVIKNNASGQIDTNLNFNGTATITGLPAPSGPTDVATKSYVDSASGSSARAWKELLLVTEQLDSANSSISQAIPFWLVNNAVEGDTLVVTDGSVTETFTFTSTPAGAFDVQIGASAAATMSNLTTAVNTDSTLWSAVSKTSLNSLNANVVALYRTDNSASDSYDDRIYGTFTTPSDAQYVNYNGETDYASSTSAQLPGADPAQKEFGFAKASFSLLSAETHVVRDADTIYVWDDDAGIWQNSGSNNPVLQDSRYVGKWVSFGTDQSVPLGGILFLKCAGSVTTSAAPMILPRAGYITAATIKVDKAPLSNNFKLSLKINGSEVASLSVPIGTSAVVDSTLQISYSANDEFSLSVERVGGLEIASVFDDVNVVVEFNEVLPLS